MVGWHHQLNGHELEQTPGVGDGQGGLACYSPWGQKKSDTTEKLNRTTFWTLVEYNGYSIPSKGFLPTVVDTMVI